MFKRILTVAFIALINTAPTVAQATPSWCKMTKNVNVRIIPTKDKISYDYSKSFLDLSKIKVDSKNPYGSKAIAHTFGIANGRFKIEQSSRLMTITNPNTKQTCIWFDSVDVKIHMSPLIMIAKEYRKGGCHFKEVMAHERDHVDVDTKVVNEYAQKLGQQLMQAVSVQPHMGPFPTSQKDAIQKKMEQRLQTIVKANNDAMMLERGRRQAQVDSKENYDAISKKIHDVCDKRSPITAKRVKKKL